MTDLYLDYNGSTPVHPEVAAAVQATLDRAFGNPTAVHPAGREAREAIDGARRTIARGIGARPDEIRLTSGGTESNNWALFGTARLESQRRHLVVSPIEHWSVRRAAEWLAKNGYEVTWVPVDDSGAVTPEAVAECIREDTFLVSVMLANNETGVIQPAPEIAAICRDHGIRYHVDAVAALGKIPVDAAEIGCDLLSLSSHKMYAPKGCGVLYVRDGIALDPLILGCGQQQGARSGTENTTGAVAFARAFELLESGELPDPGELARVRDRLWGRIRDAFPRSRRNGRGPTLPNTLSVAFEGCSGARLVEALGRHGFSVSAGAASTNATPSHVLSSMGLGEERARSTLRFSLGSGTTEETLDALVASLAELIPSGASTQTSEVTP